MKRLSVIHNNPVANGAQILLGILAMLVINVLISAGRWKSHA